jgi:hypothetical protein
MALFQIDEDQFNQLTTGLANLSTEITALSNNTAKWQAAQLQAIKDGFVLIADVLSNHQTSVSQAEIDAATERLKTSNDQLAGSVDSANQETI